jgi:peptidyl-prolyl cis-trans isomerase C
LRDTPQPKFEDVKPEIVQQLQQNKLVDFQKSLRDKAKIE